MSCGLRTSSSQNLTQKASSFLYILVKETILPVNSASNSKGSLFSCFGWFFIVLLITIWHKWKKLACFVISTKQAEKQIKIWTIKKKS